MEKDYKITYPAGVRGGERPEKPIQKRKLRPVQWQYDLFTGELKPMIPAQRNQRKAKGQH